MKIIDYDEQFFEIVPESPAESNQIRRFPGFKANSLLPKKPAVIQNIIGRFKNVHKKPIDCPKELIELLNEKVVLLDIPKDFPWLSKPYPHQELALRFLYTHGSAGLLLEPGLGKTFVILNYIKLMEFRKSLIICPKALLFVWEDEVKKHRPDLTLHVMESTSWDDKLLNAEARVGKWEQKVFKEKPNTKGWDKAHANFRSAMRDVKNIPKRQKADLDAAAAADIIVVNYEKVSFGLNFLKKMKFDFVSVDEGLIKSTKTRRTKAIHKLGKDIPFRCVMSGTLINNGPLDAFSPIKFIEPALCGGAYGTFEGYYAKIAETRKGRRFVAGVGRRQTEEVRDILASCSIVMTKDEWLDLPGKSFNRILIPMTEEQTSIYNELSSNHICSIGEGKYIEANNALTVACHLGQIANGFLYHYGEDGNDGFADLMDGYEKEAKGPRETIYIDSGKREALKNLILDQLSKRRFILWYNMQAEYTQIMEVLDDLGINSSQISGGSKNTGAVVHEFNDSDEIQVLVCQSQSVNYGITVLGKNPEALENLDVEILPEFDTRVYTHVFWSLCWSLERYTQQQDRSHRIGQEHEVDYWILATDCGIENLIWERLSSKEDIRDAILVDYIRSIST